MALEDRDAPRVSLALPFAPSSPGEARARLADDLTQAGVRQSVIDDALLVLSELVTNGIRHGRPNGDGTLHASWTMSASHLRLSVLDGGSVDTLTPLSLNDVSLSGRGLHIVNFVCDSWSVENDGGTRIIAELALGE